jgi:hypothetical protein
MSLFSHSGSFVMALAAACPDMQTLQQLAVGRMPPAEVERLARHCEKCER